MRIQATIVFEQNWEAIHAKNPDGSRRYRYIINTGSSRSSKTISLIDCYDAYARSERDKRLTVWRDTKTDCKKTVLTDALKHFKKTGRYKVNQEFNKTESIFTYGTNSTFEVHGTDDEETVHGLTQDVAWFNEPYKISKDTFDQIDQRTSDCIVIDWNPKKDHWIDDLLKDERTIVIHSTFRDNPFCPEEQRHKILSYQSVKYALVVTDGKISEEDAKAYDLDKNLAYFTEKEIKELQRCRTNELKNSSDDYKWQVYGLGSKAERPNRIFRFTEISPDYYNKINAKIYTGVDWGAVDPWGIVDVKYYDGSLYLNERNYLSENKLREILTPAELNQISNSDEGMVTWYFNKLQIDKSREIVCDNNRPAKIIALRRAGWDYAIAAEKGAGSIVDGIDLVNDLKVYYTSTSINLKYEQENYSRRTDRYGVVEEEPEDANNHLMDPIRYVAQKLFKKGIIKK